MASKITGWRERKATGLIEKILKKRGVTLEELKIPGHTKANVAGRREVSILLLKAGFTYTEVGGLLNRDHTAISLLIGRKKPTVIKNPEAKTQSLDDVIDSVRDGNGPTVSRKSALLLAEEVERLRAFEQRLLKGNLAGIVQQQQRQQGLLRTYDAMFTCFLQSFKLLEKSRHKTNGRQQMLGASHMLTAVVGDTPSEKYRRDLEERVRALIAGETTDFEDGAE